MSPSPKYKEQVIREEIAEADEVVDDEYLEKELKQMQIKFGSQSSSK